MLPKRLVFCGGGTRCLVFLSTLVEFEKEGKLRAVTEWWGASAGALIAGLLAVSRSAPAVKTAMLSADYQKFRDFDISNMLSITISWGLDNGAALLTEIERLFESVAAGSKSLRMRDVPGLSVVVADITIHKTVVVNSTSHPDLRVVEAIRASMSLPIMFKPYKEPSTGHIWVDGGVRANFPWDQLPDDAARAEALGFNFTRSWWYSGPSTFLEYLFSMIHFDEPQQMLKQQTAWPNNILWYKSPPFPPWFTCFKSEDYALVESMGLDVAREWLSRIDTNETPAKPKRPQLASSRRCERRWSF